MVSLNALNTPFFNASLFINASLPFPLFVTTYVTTPSPLRHYSLSFTSLPPLLCSMRHYPPPLLYITT